MGQSVLFSLFYSCELNRSTNGNNLKQMELFEVMFVTSRAPYKPMLPVYTTLKATDTAVAEVAANA